MAPSELKSAAIILSVLEEEEEEDSIGVLAVCVLPYTSGGTGWGEIGGFEGNRHCYISVVLKRRRSKNRSCL